MSEAYKYFYALSAACFVGVGSGLMTLVPYLFDREAEVIKVATSYEQRVGVEYDESFDCAIGEEHYAECKYADYMASSNATLVNFFKTLAYWLFAIGLLSAMLGFYYQHR